MNQRKESVHKGHRRRLRDRYETNGLDGFQDHEVLELLLGFGIAQKDTNPIAHALIDRFGNLQGVFDASKDQLMQVPNVGEYSAFLLKLLPDIARRYYEEIHNDDLRIGTIASRVDFFVPRFIGCKEECLFAAFTDASNRLIECSCQFVGSVNAVELHATKIAKAALLAGAKHVFIAHNHFEDPLPSNQDVSATRSLFLALDAVDIRLIDHIVVCGTKGISMVESGHFAKATY